MSSPWKKFDKIVQTAKEWLIGLLVTFVFSVIVVGCTSLVVSGMQECIAKNGWFMCLKH
jgi:hypothetical protein